MGPVTCLILLLTAFHHVSSQTSRDRTRGPSRSEEAQASVFQRAKGVTSLRGDIDLTDFSSESDKSDFDGHHSSEAVPWYEQEEHLAYVPSRQLNPCEQSSCSPPSGGNLLIGREARLTASSTCGLHRQERFCIVSHLEERKKCFWCDSRDQFVNDPARSHRIENIVYKNFPGTDQRSWWQSENGIENVTIQLDLESEFRFTHLIITFKTFRPAAMLIERSYDFGRTWKVYRYFAHNCEEEFPGIPIHEPRTLTDVVCESKYSSVAPSTGGEVIFRVLPPNLRIDDPYSPEVQNLLKLTNLRINFTKLHTLGDDLLDDREEIQEKYYYAINHMVVRGSCSCYGHANHCVPLFGVENKQNMVHGRCQCTHNTKGLNCEQCEDFYNDLPWKPAIGKQTNACKKCNCNEHATSCHFDAAVYELTGRVSGGVCDSCQHNTMGRNCEQCRDFYYHEPSRDITDPDACQPCDCDPRGSLDEGICDSRTDVSNGLESGKCHCKSNVDGRRCDRCKNGYWKFDEDNPDGCQPCTCNTQGTIDNQGCNVYTGECTCKRYVTGRDCNQCLPEYWGLSDDRDGCKPCDCDAGGAFDNNCDVITGQCRCQPHVIGRTCNQPEQSYYTGTLDFLVYEAELSRGSDNCQVVIREPYRDGRENSWTGTGFMRVFENSELEFDINNIQTSMEYDIVIRYEPQLPEEWDEVKVTIIRPDAIDRNGPCANSVPQDDIKHVSLPPGSRYVSVYPPVCLEGGKPYKVLMEFRRYSNEGDTPTASVLIDSIALIPRIDAIPFFHGSPANEIRRQDFERYRCGQAYYQVIKGNVPDVCNKYHYSIGFYVHGGAFSCQCDTTGSLSSLCSGLGGSCQCKPNVVGRRCDRCAPGTFGFGPEGCRACDCNSIGALDNFCDAFTGQCKCRPNTYGRECDQCQPGFWNFPNCERCECNGHADICDSSTGACISCRDWTMGHACDRCLEGYFGDPRIGIDIPCRSCPCPGTIESGHSYANRCALDAATQDVVCECAVGYAGSRCDVCADNYFGNPEIPGGSCRSCNCNKNIDISRPGNCDVHTGECLQCLFNTEGFNCQYCKANYYGDAINQECKECVCSLLGTNKAIGVCDRVTGQCPCLPNVIGQRCEECAENHWKIASGEGCEPCDCDPVGAVAKQCNLYDGQCECREGFGGRRCNECQSNFWGNPKSQCFPCDCDPDGSATLQCHRGNGTCVCEQGIGGDKCNVCARGYLGKAPYCNPCGECFDNWDRILDELKDQTHRVIQTASNIKQTGAKGAYTREFEKMEKHLGEISALLESTTISPRDIDELETLVEGLRSSHNISIEGLDEVEKKLQNLTRSISVDGLNLQSLQERAKILQDSSQNLKDNATQLQEANVEGALNSTRHSQRQAEDAERKADETFALVADSERQCKRADALVNHSATHFSTSREENVKALEDLERKLDELEESIPDLNDKVCDKRGNPCSNLCGGAGCGSCGGIACEQGTVMKADRALKYAEDSQKIIHEQEAAADELLRVISHAHREMQAAEDMAKEAYDNALAAHEVWEDKSNKTADLQYRWDKFNEMPGATASEIRIAADRVLRQKITYEPQEINELARNISEAGSSLTNIDSVLSDTNENLTLAQNLKTRADLAKTEAKKVLNTAKSNVDALDKAKEAQDKANDLISTAKEYIEIAEKDLVQIRSETTAATTDAHQKANDTRVKVDLLQGRLKRIQTNFIENEHNAQEVGKKVKEVEDGVEIADKRARILSTKYDEAHQKLQERARESGKARTRAQELFNKANALYVKSKGRSDDFQGVERDYKNNTVSFNDILRKIKELNDNMELYLTQIQSKSEYYRTCQS